MTAPRAGAGTRALAVLAVLLGLFAMHGLASTHHATADTTAAQHRAAPDDANGHPHSAIHFVAQEAVAAVLPAGPGCDEGCADLALLCAAVLAGAAVALLRARCGAPLVTAPPRHDRATRAPPVWLTRPPDPVKELCVSRT